MSWIVTRSSPLVSVASSTPAVSARPTARAPIGGQLVPPGAVGDEGGGDRGAHADVPLAVDGAHQVVHWLHVARSLAD